MLFAGLFCKLLYEKLLGNGPGLAKPQKLLQYEVLILLATHIPTIQRGTARILEKYDTSDGVKDFQTKFNFSMDQDNLTFFIQTLFCNNLTVSKMLLSNTDNHSNMATRYFLFTSKKDM